MIDPKSQLGRLCDRLEVAVELPTAPLYTFESARESVIALAHRLVSGRPHLREDAEQTALLAAWEATDRGSAEVEFAAIDAAVRRAVRGCVDDCTERRRKDAEPPPYSIDFPALFDEPTAAETKARYRMQSLQRIVEKYGPEAVVLFTKYRYSKSDYYRSTKGAGAKSGIAAADAAELDSILRAVNPLYQQRYEQKRAAARRRREAARAEANRRRRELTRLQREAVQ